MVKQRRSYSAAEFDRGAAVSRMERSTIELARQVLVEGKRQADVARGAKVARQWVSEVVIKMQGYIQQANPVPDGWKADTVTLPLRDWPRVRAIEEAAWKALGQQGKPSKKQR